MTEFAKLRTGTDLGAQLLRAGMHDAPKRAARHAAERALGLSLVTVAAAAAPVAGAEAAKSTLVKLSTGILARWFGWGLLAGAATGGGAHVVSALARESVRQDAGASVSSATRGESELDVRAKRIPDAMDGRSRTAASAVSPTPAPVADAVPSERETSNEHGAPRAAGERVPATAAQAPSSNTAGDSALGREIALLEGVRAKVRSGDAPGALAELDRVAPAVRLLASEAQLLRVEALLENGERARARALAAEIERKNPGGSQGFRLRRLLGTP